MFWTRWGRYGRRFPMAKMMAEFEAAVKNNKRFETSMLQPSWSCWGRSSFPKHNTLMFQDLQHPFHPFFQSPFQSLFRDMMFGDAPFSLPYRVNEKDNQWQITMDVPGVKPSDLDLRLEKDGRVLRLSGARSYDSKKKEQENGAKDEGGENDFSVNSSSQFETLIDLENLRNVDVDQFTAKLVDGVLTVSAPKKEGVVEEEHLRKIDIEDGSNKNQWKVAM